MFEKIAELNRSLRGKGANVAILNSELRAVQQNFCDGQKVSSKNAFMIILLKMRFYFLLQLSG
jgi:hypothetical protein